MPPKRPFVTLQDRFVSSLAVACCPTMDLVAVLTLDHHLVVHRTTSWQKLLHVKPSDVSFEVMTLAWRPDGLQLAVGCDNGNVVIFEIESGILLPDRCNSFRHEHCITAMHWAPITKAGASNEAQSADKRRQRKGPGAFGDFWSSHDAISQSKIQFRDRASRFLAANREAASPDTLLVTADDRGFVALWWMGRVLLTRINVSEHFSEEEFRILDSMRHQQGHTGGFRVEQVNFAADLSLFFVLLVFFSDGTGQVDNTIDGNVESKLYRILALDMTAIQHIYVDVALVASTVDCVHTLLDQIATYGRQMSTEWKNTTRIFELKMGLIGSLYEKYACEDLPQEDMLSVLVTGITPPALAQYFAQDIQEMSVHRMQKALSSGCDSLRTLAEGKLKHALVNVLFYLSELSGHAKWNAQKYAATLGITVSALDDLVQATQDALIDLEALTLAIHETLQDFALFFQWLVERIRIHTNSNQLRETSSAAVGGRDSSNPSSSKSLLNLRRLCDFLQRAAEAAQRFRQQQPNHSVYKVETTFGNLVSLQLSAQPIPSKGRTGQSGAGFLILIRCIQDQWSAMLDAVAKTLAQTTRREKSGCITIGSTSNAVEECQIHFRQPFIEHRSEEIAKNEDQSDDDKSDEETIDWDSLKHYGHMLDDKAYCSTMMVGFRLQSGVLLLLRALLRMDFFRPRHKSSSRLTWDTAVINFSGRPPASAVVCRSFDFYGDGSPDKQERLAFVLGRPGDGQVHQEWLYLQPYDNVEFTHVNATVSFEMILAQSVTHTFTLDDAQGRAVASSSAPSQSGKNAISVISAASRGVLCVIFPPSRLAVFDAEDCEDDDNEYDDGVIDK